MLQNEEDSEEPEAETEEVLKEQVENLNVEIKSLNNDKSQAEDKIKETEMLVEQVYQFYVICFYVVKKSQ